MLSVAAYYDGKNYITEGNVAVKPNQRVIITFLDSEIQPSKKASASKILDDLTGIISSSEPLTAKDIRAQRLAERYGV